MKIARFKIFGAIFFGIIAFVFSFFLMFHTFSYDTSSHSIQIASKLWSDFGAHIPLIRSFSHGANFSRLVHGKPIESPLYPDEPIRYHFGFYALVGILEKIGLRLDWALNIPSALGFFTLIVLIYSVSYVLFKNSWTSLLSVLFFLFNGSLSFIQFFKTHTILDIFTNSHFPVFGPWDGQNITAFWTLNIYTNQRHLALSYALILGIIFMTLHPAKKYHTSILIALCMSTLLFINFAAAAIAMLFLIWIFLIKKESRPVLFLAGIVCIPAFLALRASSNTTQHITVDPGYLIHHPITARSFLFYWWQNLGLHVILIPIGFILSSRNIKRLLGIPLTLLFILPNIYRFSPDMINNHKFFNFFMIIGGMFSAYAVMQIRHIRHIGLISLICLVFFLTLSGIIDYFPIINDPKGLIPDVAISADSRFFKKHTKPTDIIANSTWFYHPASLAGRALFSGYTYFTWSYGYDQGAREHQLIRIYEAVTLPVLCTLLKTNHVSYIELSKTPESYVHPNTTLWNTLIPAYENPQTHLKVYSTNTICR